MPRLGSKEKIKKFLLANIGRVIESHELQAAADGAVQYSRRLRELRDEEGWPILSHNTTLQILNRANTYCGKRPKKAAASRLRAAYPQSCGLRCSTVTVLPARCAASRPEI